VTVLLAAVDCAIATGPIGETHRRARASRRTRVYRRARIADCAGCRARRACSGAARTSAASASSVRCVLRVGVGIPTSRGGEQSGDCDQQDPFFHVHPPACWSRAHAAARQQRD
jgi:hypothetical protein